MLSSKKAFVQISLLMLVTATPKLLVSFSSSLIDPVFAQSSKASDTFPLPKSVPSGTTVKVDGSKSMRVINEALKKRFIEKFADAKVEIKATGSDQALAALLKGEITLAAIGRPLTDKEKSQGLVAIPVSREKIAIIVGADNSFKGNLTFEQFAKMFRGEITNWSQVGGKPGVIRFIDHPDSSDTRRSLSTYATFKKAPFKRGSKAIRLSEDDTATIVKSLGKNGISYAIADQVLDLKNVRVISMHKTLPTDPRYPYSQPRSYIYKKQTTGTGVTSFLGFATSTQGKKIVEVAKDQEAETVRKSVTAAPSPSPTGNASATTTASKDREFPWWLLLLLIPLGGGLWWLLKGNKDKSDTPESNSSTSGTTPPVPGETTSVETRQGASLPTDSATVSTAVTPQIDVPNGAVTSGIATITGNNVASASKEVETSQGASLPTNGIASAGSGSSDAVGGEPGAISSTATSGITGAIAGIAGAGIAGAGVAGLAGRSLRSHITLVPRDNQAVLATWEVQEQDKEWARLQGGRQLQLRIYQVRAIDFDIQPAHNLQTIEVDELSSERHVSVPVGAHDYIAEIGYITGEGQWLQLARSNSVWVSSLPTVETTQPANSGGATVLTTGVRPSPLAITSSLVLRVGDNQEILAAWEVPSQDLEWARLEGGRQFQLRIYDVSGIDFDSQPAQNIQTIDCDELSTERHVQLPVGDRDYVAEIGYITGEGQWLQLARSNSVWVSAPDVSAPTVETTQAANSAGATVLKTGVRPSPLAITSSLVLRVGDHQDILAAWEVPSQDLERARLQGGQQFQLRIYDLSGINDLQPAQNLQTIEVDELSSERHVSVTVGDRDYVAEIGYITLDGQWLQLARSNSVWVSSLPTVETTQAANSGGATVATTGVRQSATSKATTSSFAVSTSDNQQVYARARWQVSQADRLWAKQQGGRQFQLRIYEVTGINLDVQPSNYMQTYDCDEFATEQQVQVPVGDRDYVVEIGYITLEGLWLQLARSNSVRLPSSVSNVETTQAVHSTGATAIANGTIKSTNAITTSRLVLKVSDNQHLISQWQVSSQETQWARLQGGRQFQLRIYQVTGINFDPQPTHSMQTIDCDELATERQVQVAIGDRDYVAEIGYITLDGQWLQLARSNAVWVSASNLVQSSLETTEVTLAGEALTTQKAVELPPEQLPIEEPSFVAQEDCCKIQHLTVHSRNNCFVLNSERMKNLQETAVSKMLEPGIYVVRIKSGIFSYSSNVNQGGQPIVLLWVYGGKVINKKTKVPVAATWSTLNGYDDTLTLEVLETATLSTFFFDTYLDDNDGEVTVSVARLYQN